jgi:hypothetical protein
MESASLGSVGARGGLSPPDFGADQLATTA